MPSCPFLVAVLTLTRVSATPPTVRFRKRGSTERYRFVCPSKKRRLRRLSFVDEYVALYTNPEGTASASAAATDADAAAALQQLTTPVFELAIDQGEDPRVGVDVPRAVGEAVEGGGVGGGGMTKVEGRKSKAKTGA